MKDLNHFEYTALAVNVYHTYTQKEEDSTFKQSLSQSSQDEDKFNPLGLDFQRIYNWHFYNNHGSIDDTPLVPGSRTSENRVISLIKKIKKQQEKYRNATAEEKEDAWEYLIDASGRLIHHIQDMSTFSHVVPVYHGPGLKDSYEVFGAKLVNKITVVPQRESVANSLHIPITSEEIKTVIERYEGKSLFDIYDISAKETLNILNSDNDHFELTLNGETTQRRWNSFWREHSNSDVDPCSCMENKFKDFGSFGELCNHFGEPFFTVGDNFYEVNHTEYMKIYKKMMKKSILDTVAVIDKLFSEL
ncbi:hypothetical protein [Sulfurovum mangrovi]|uniref:hypothetical protein n=1 Tax=Sulfurovum mangrovi TaxID=2893889 RepID=UPI001E57655E|nr:hypothetical protein [Sulfurovum mangrovi]UFH60370.1 hypothetical protein LN246_05825 [Sulfurovum mangrovi]